MRTLGVIPARYQSTRFPGKVLADLLGKPLIQHTYEQALKARSLDDLVIAADDQRVVKAADEFGAHVVMTARGHASGTDRICEVANSVDAEIVVNIQADEPLISASMIDELVDSLLQDKEVPMASLACQIKDMHELIDSNVVKVVKDVNNFALYFSRSTIPYLRDSLAVGDALFFYKHLGIYAYTKDFLFTFTNLTPGPLETAEKLEQLRALEHGYKIKLVETQLKTIGVDTPGDLEKVKMHMLNSGHKS